MQTELTLQKLNEARKAADENTAEMIDVLAKTVMFQQDIRSPMLGAKVTLYLRPPTTRRQVAVSDCPYDEDDWQWKYSLEDEEKYDNLMFEWLVEPDDPSNIEELVVVDVKQNDDDPDLVPHKALVFEGNVGEAAPEGELWDPNEQEYKMADDYPLGTVNCIVGMNHRGEPRDPNRKYLEDFEDDYVSHVAVYTSIVPADDEPSNHEYTPGWE